METNKTILPNLSDSDQKRIRTKLLSVRSCSVCGQGLEIKNLKDTPYYCYKCRLLKPNLKGSLGQAAISTMVREKTVSRGPYSYGKEAK